MAFLTICKDVDSKTSGKEVRESLDYLWEKFEQKKDQTKNIISAGQSAGYTPLHLLARKGNAIVMEWYLEKWQAEDEVDRPDIDQHDSQGNTALFLACWQGTSLSENFT